MASKIIAGKPDDSEYEIIEGASESALAAGTSPWVDSSTLKLRHRIGRGPFGDVWLATHHQSTDDYDEHHEVAIKMLHPIKENQRRVVVDKFEDLFSKCQGMENVCLLRGVSSISGKICIIMKFYEGSVGDKMARLKGGKLLLPDILRYGVDLASGILELHSKGFLILNLKPSNFLLSDNDKAILGDVGIPYLLRSIPVPSSDMTVRLGTPNYMAPEQWQPEVRGPMSFETDSWGFGCSIVEMLTGVQPWSGRSADEIYDLVVRKQEKLNIPNGIPPPLENLLRGCILYDLRSRPSMTDILHVLKSLQNSEEEEIWRGIDSTEIRKSSTTLGYTEWFLSKDHLQVGDTVRSRKPASSFKHENMDVPGGMVVGLERDTTDPDGFALVKVHGVHDPLRVHVSVLERVTNGLASGDWVRLKHGNKRHSPVGVLHSIDREGNVAVGFIGLPTLWKGTSSQLQMANAYRVGRFVKLKANVVIPRFKWMRKSIGIWATGRISQVLPNGCLEVDFPGVLPFKEEHGSFLADPAEVEIVNFNTCEGVMKKYEHLEDLHWAVRPLLIAMGLLTAMKLGFFVKNKIGRSKDGKQRDGSSGQGDCQIRDGQKSRKSKWLVFV
ncbi:PREDICTED: E3 ubiquitin-protein ligase KEG-like [Camelina sativa]|uniref:E3 ubiquitin-protein ligase KEG-like n=1 Tax=Camelina sativa TaxID=90675 RepID=A0ABM0UWM4_CAMSA|nr:PREDICTED: E3 ubiquitin-protein ligase KEG-like [Camelina sativa]XP_010447421.1 PREDICTED: E3 ubiquitin-protein ligase KEG-like [Camelina sativa]XP_010447423.1 PREDICTED: E3 ubiquitin-protein ligase KEG-like [Camelina sativa]